MATKAMDRKYKETIAVEDNQGNYWVTFGQFQGAYLIGWQTNNDKTFARIIDPETGEHVAVFCENVIIEGKQYLTKAIFEI